MRELLDTYKWPIIGGFAGLLIGILFLTLGIFKTILILLLVLVGGYVGLYMQNNPSIRQLQFKRKN